VKRLLCCVCVVLLNEHVRQFSWLLCCGVVTADTSYAIYSRFFAEEESRTAFVAHFAGFIGGELRSLLVSVKLSPLCFTPDSELTFL